MLPAPGLDQLHHPVRGGIRRCLRPRRAIVEAVLAMVLVALVPFRQAGSRDSGFSRDMGQGTAVLDTADEAESTFRGQWRVIVGHRGAGSLSLMTVFSRLPIMPREGLLLFFAHPIGAVNNVKPRNI